MAKTGIGFIDVNSPVPNPVSMARLSNYMNTDDNQDKGIMPAQAY